jgi:hypothetical protein
LPAAQTTQFEHSDCSQIEITIAVGYRKEIDQQEYVWRSLQVFAATLALQLAATFHIATRLPPIGTMAGRASVGVMVLTGMLMAVALGLLAACIALARFQYVSSESALLTFVEALKRAGEGEAAQRLGRGFGSQAQTMRTACRRDGAQSQDKATAQSAPQLFGTLHYNISDDDSIWWQSC